MNCPVDTRLGSPLEFGRRQDHDGKVLTNFYSSVEEAAHVVAIDSRGRIIAAGTAEVEGEANQFAVARYREDGSLDSSFDHDGKVLTDFLSMGGERGFTVTIDARDRVLVAGIANP